MTNDKLLEEVAEAIEAEVWSDSASIKVHGIKHAAQAVTDIFRKRATIKTDNTQVIINMQKQIDELVEALRIISNGSSILDSEIAYKAITVYRQKVGE